MVEKSLQEQISAMRTALRFYANEEHWHTTVIVPDGSYPGRIIPAPGAKEMTIRGGEIISVTAIDQDGGRRAREVLALLPKRGGGRGW